MNQYYIYKSTTYLLISKVVRSQHVIQILAVLFINQQNLQKTFDEEEEGAKHQRQKVCK